ncbi:transaldolase [bacterium]|nr:MAG: transaldolase [bacterium]
MGKLEDLASLGQSAWLDYIDRNFVLSGGLSELVSKGLKGVTSNPTIFENAIAKSDYYDKALAEAVRGGAKSPADLYEALVFEDIRMAADALLPVFRASNEVDGFVCLEENPALAHDRDKTVAEAKRLFKAVGRPNVLIKVPGTPEGIEAFRTLTAEGVNINVTLIFSLAQYEAVANAYVEGLQKRQYKGGDLRKSSSVASLFVSRLDTAMDRELENARRTDLRGKFAIDSARLAYKSFQDIFTTPHCEKLGEVGAHYQRLLIASSGTKNPAYPDTKYVDNLIGPLTVNTMPLATLNAFMDHGKVLPTIENDVDKAAARRSELARAGIDIDAVTDKLLVDGLKLFQNSYDSLLKAIEEKAKNLK